MEIIGYAEDTGVTSPGSPGVGMRNVSGRVTPFVFA